MTVLNKKQKTLLNKIQAAAYKGNQKTIPQTEVQTAMALKRKGLIRLSCLTIRDHKYYAAILDDPKFYEIVLDDPKSKIIEDQAKMLENRARTLARIRTYIAELQLAAEALEDDLEFEDDQELLLSHLRKVLPNGRIRALRQALKAKILRLKKGSLTG